MIVKLTRIPPLNSVVIKQENGHFFISTPNSIIIDKAGLVRLIEELGYIGFISWHELEEIGDHIYMNRSLNADEENSNNTSIG